jgi:hypothetical protein
VLTEKGLIYTYVTQKFVALIGDDGDYGW